MASLSVILRRPFNWDSCYLANGLSTDRSLNNQEDLNISMMLLLLCYRRVVLLQNPLFSLSRNTPRAFVVYVCCFEERTVYVWKERQRETAFIPFLLESMSGVWNSPISLLLCCWLLPLLPMMPHTIEYTVYIRRRRHTYRGFFLLHLFLGVNLNSSWP